MTHPRETCIVRKRLLRRVTAVVIEHSEATSEIEILIAETEPDSEDLVLLSDELKHSFNTVKTAWDEYQKHVRRHPY